MIDKNGFEVTTFNEIFENLCTKLKEIYGQDIILDQNSQDGQQVGIFALATSDLYDLALQTYNSYDPDFAEGINLDRHLKLLGRTRRSAIRSCVDILVTTKNQITLPQNYTIKDINNQEWILLSSKSLTKGEHLVTFYAKKFGPITLQKDTTLSQITIFTDVLNLTNESEAIIGRDEESDQELRVRRNKMLEINAKSTIGSIISKILELNGVIDCVAYENRTKIYDEEHKLNPHSYWLVIDGGDIEEIIKTICKDKTGGCDLKGKISGEWIEEFEKQDGNKRYHVHEAKFDRPILIELFIRFDVKKRNADKSIPKDEILQALSNKEFVINENLVVTELYSYIYQSNSDFIATNLEVSIDGQTWKSDSIASWYDEKFIIKQENIEINEI